MKVYAGGTHAYYENGLQQFTKVGCELDLEDLQLRMEELGLERPDEPGVMLDATDLKLRDQYQILRCEAGRFVVADLAERGAMEIEEARTKLKALAESEERVLDQYRTKPGASPAAG